MKSFSAQHNLLALIAFVLLFAGCKQPETIVVDQSPAVAPSSDTTETDNTKSEASFRKLVVGEFNTISTLDPLFADNASSMRAVQLVYEGLVRLNKDGEVIPAMAHNWEVAEDSLEYTFHLRPNIFYHDNEVFSTGTGRKLVSQDVKSAFERMAHAGVPPEAGHMFMDIKGFNSYFQEQREVYNPTDRQLNGVSGIQTPNDTTVVFELNKPDAQFLKKLASPLAVIYPQEAVGGNLSSFSPVGTGPFTFSSRSADSTLIFSRFQNYYNASDINLNRVDIVVGDSESNLFRAMSANEIYLIPQLGPQLLQNLVDSNGRLNTSYQDRYNLQVTNGATEFVLRFNPASNLTSTSAQTISELAKSNSSYFDQFPGDIVTTNFVNQTDTTKITALSNQNDQIYSTYSQDPFVRTYLGNLSSTLSNYNTQLQMIQIRAPSRNTGLLFTVNYPLITDKRWSSYDDLFRFRVKQAALYRSEIKGLNFNQYPWWFDVRGLTLPAAERLN